MRLICCVVCGVALLVNSIAAGADWLQFRGPGGAGVSDEKGLPAKWSASENIIWKTPLPGFGASSPITVGKRIFLSCYSGYGFEKGNAGNVADLRLHLVCIDRDTGKIKWNKSVPGQLKPTDHAYHYGGFIALHGYASGTPVSDGKSVFVFFGPYGVHAYDLDGNELWNKNVGKKVHGFGTGSSPILTDNHVIVNASVESERMVALDKKTGNEAWSTPEIKESWSTPLLISAPGGKKELVLITWDKLLGVDPSNGNPLWHTAGSKPPRYICPSATQHNGVIYAIHGYFGPLVAVRPGGRGDVTSTHQVWSHRKGSNVGSPVYHDGHLYWANDQAMAICVNATNGQRVFEQKLEGTKDVYASPLAADGKLYFVSRKEGTYVLAAKPKFELISHNVIGDDKSVFNASAVPSDKAILLRSDKFLYCIGSK